VNDMENASMATETSSEEGVRSVFAGSALPP